MKERFKQFIRSNRWFKWVPNFLTICNSLCGFAAILYMLRAYEVSVRRPDATLDVFAVSAVVIFGAMVFDALDGFAARIFNAASMHGIQMDSLSDMVTFGVAPAVLVAVMTHSLRAWSLGRGQEILVYLLCSVYIGCAALRLATYNVHAMIEKKSSDKFSGLPSPGAASAICVTVLFAQNCSFDLARIAFVLPLYAAVLGLLMVCPVPYTHVGKWLTSVHRNRKRAVVVLILAGILIVFRVNGLMVLVTGYILSGPAAALAGKLFRREPSEPLNRQA